MRRTLLALALPLTGLVLAACGDGGDSAGPQCFLDERRFRDLSASPGTAPVFSWCGAPARTLSVQTVANLGTVWRVECTGAVPLCIDPPVAYGDSLPSTTTTAAPPLQAGVQYQFCVFGVEDRPPSVCQQFSP